MGKWSPLSSRASARVLKLRFADIVILLTPGFEIPRTYKPFLFDGQPDVTLQVYHGSIPSCEWGTLVFDPGGNWSLYQDDKKWVIPVSPPGSSKLWRLALFDLDFCSGEVYVRSRETEQASFYPLAYPLDEVLMVNLLSRGRGVLLHACGISYGGRGTIFAGTSGAGKSTLATLWEGREEVTLLSDDRVIVRQRNGRFWIYGTPWHGDARAASPDAVPLERIFIIRHGSENRAIPLSPLNATSCLLVRSFPAFWDAEGMAFTLEFLGQLSQAVPCYELGFVPDESVVDFVRCLT